MRRVALLIVAIGMLMVLVSCKSTNTPKTASAPVKAVEGASVDVAGETGTPKEGSGSALASKPRVVGAVVAVVNSDIVTKEEVTDALAPAFAKVENDPSLTEQGRRETRALLVEEEVRFRVNRLLALQEAHRRLTEDEQDKIQHDVDTYFKERIRQLGSAAQLEKVLATEGKTIESKKAEETDRRTMAALLDTEIGQHVSVSPAEMTAYYHNHREEYHQKRAVQIRQIFLAFKNFENESKAQEKGLELLNRLKKGEDFAHVAKDYSQDPNAVNGGLWPEYITEGEGQMRPEVEHAVFALEVKQTSSLIKSEIGYHIVRVEDVRPDRQIPFVEVQEQIGDTLRNEKLDAKRKELIDRLWKNSYVKISWK